MATKPPSKDSKPDAKAPAKAGAKTDPKAQGKDADEAEGDETAAPKKRGKLLIILAALVLLGGGGGGAAWYALKGEATPDGKPVAAKPAPSKPPVFIALEAFTVNLQHDDSTAQYLQVGLSLKVADPAAVEAIKLRMPEVRNRVLLLLSSKKASELATPQGKEALSADLVKEINKPLGGAEGGQGIETVLFTSFVIQ